MAWDICAGLPAPKSRYPRGSWPLPTPWMEKQRQTASCDTTKKVLSITEAAAIIRAGAGKQFDPVLVDALFLALEEVKQAV